ncbi:LuxR C-terminal-related transcriptional regulator [Serratia fonticola]|uniref:LuxR C-terminal-related transcriptional regulator n=1 Tax=Serratia fonticola TaxID=47917 RepID=UPI00217C9FB7|nr:LuxR C-terminal-related transcriptional regulator [Serratia fonticola]CAI1724812.1 Capsular synthesis regulator component B [Serratia fonticola]
MEPWNPISQVAVVSPCQMERIALQALFSRGPCKLSWLSENYQGQVLQQLLERPVDLLQAIRLIQRLQAMYVKPRLIVTIDVDIPYLVSRLRDWGIDKVITLRLPLADWHKQFHLIDGLEIPSLIEQPAGRRQRIKIASLSPMESRIMRYFLEGFSLSEIAGLMMRSIKTISGQKSRALHKMGISHYAQLVALKPVFVAIQNEYESGRLIKVLPDKVVKLRVRRPGF